MKQKFNGLTLTSYLESLAKGKNKVINDEIFKKWDSYFETDIEDAMSQSYLFVDIDDELIKLGFKEDEIDWVRIKKIVEVYKPDKNQIKMDI